MQPSDIEHVQPDPADYIRVDWDWFRRLHTLINHWERPGWTNGRRSYHWMVRFDHCFAVRMLAARCQDGLRHLATLDLVPANSLHMTLQRVAFTDEITAVDIHAVVSAACDRYAALPMIDATIGPLAGSAGAVRFSVGPHEPIRRIRDAARAAVADVRGTHSLPARATDFVPHVSVAYNNTPTDAHPVIEQVERLRRCGSVATLIDTVDLVELRRDGPSYTWSPIASIPLAERKLIRKEQGPQTPADPRC